MNQPQTLANHGKIVPAFHFFVLRVLGLNLAQALYWMYLP